MLTSYRCHLLTIAVIFLLFIYFQLDPLPYLFIAGIVFLVLAYLVSARSAKGSNWTLGLNYGPNSTVAKPPDYREPRSSASTTSSHQQNRNLKHVLPSENVTHNYVGLSTPWGRTASSAGQQRRRAAAGRTMGMGSSQYHDDAKSNISRSQPYQTTSASSLYRQPTTSSLSQTSGLANQVLTAAYPQVQQPRYGRLGFFPTINLNPQPLPLLKERNTNMMHSPVTIKVGPSTKLYPSRADYLYGSNITRPPDMDVVIPALGTRKRTCMSPSTDEVNEQAKRQCREENASNRSEFSPLHPVPSVLNGMLRSTANILMQQSVGSQKRRFDGSTENLSVKRNRNNEISSSYSSSRRLAKKRKKHKLSLSSTPSLKAHKGDPNKSSEENLEEAVRAQSPIPCLPLSKPLVVSSPGSGSETSGVVNTTSENSNLSVSETPSSIPLTQWSEGFSRKRQLPVYASVSASAIAKPLYVPEGSVSVEDDHRDLQASQARLQKIMAGVSKAFQAKDEKMKSQRTPGQVAFMPSVQSPDIASPLSLGASGFTTSTPVTSLQVLPSLPAESSLTSTPILNLAATSSSAGLLSIATSTAVTAVASTSLAVTGGTPVTCMTTSAPSSTSVMSPSLTFGFTAVTTQSSMPIVSSAPTSNDSATSLVQSASTLASAAAVTGTTSIVPSFSNAFSTSNKAPIPTSSDPLPLGGLLPSSTNNLTSTGTALSLPFPSSGVVITAESTQKQPSFQMTAPTNLIGFAPTNFSASTSSEVSGNPPPYPVTVSASATSGSSATASSFPSFAFSAVTSTSLATSQLPTVAVTTTVTVPQFSLTNTLATTAGGSPFVLNSSLTSTQNPQQELGRLTEASSSNPFTTSNFGVLPSTRENTSTFSFQNAGTTVATGLPSLPFGSLSANLASSNNTSAASTLVSPFGSSTTVPAADTFNKPSNSATTPFFQLNSSVSQTAPAQTKPLLQFSGTSVANGSTSQFQFGQNNASNVPSSSFATTSSQSAPAFNFGSTTSAAHQSIQFGQSTSSEASAPIKPAAAASLFQFGPTSATSGLAGAAPSFNFGNTNTSFGGSSNNALGGSNTGGFTFSLSSAAGPSPSTFQTSTASSNFFTPQNAGVESTAFGTPSNSGFNFGSGTTNSNLLSNGSNPAQPNTGSIFQFGTGATTQAAPTGASGGFNFGAQSQQISAGGFNFNMGATPDLNFGATRNTVSSSGSSSSARRSAQARRRINR